MENDLQVILKGLDDETGSKIGNSVAGAIRAFAESSQPLDFRRMHRIIVAADFPGELAELSKSTVSGKIITHTNENYATAVAQVLLLPRGSGAEIVPVLSANVLIKLTENPESEPFRWVLHLLHHEFCHVHDFNKKLDVLGDYFLKHRYMGKDMYVRPLAEICWSEYIANRLSSGSAIEASVFAMSETLKDAIVRTKPQIDAEIMAYRIHNDLDGLMKVFRRHGEFLVKAAAYVMGYMDGFGKPLSELSPQTAEGLAGSYFEPIWNEIYFALQEMARIYPDGWKSLEVYDHLALAMEEYYATMGLFLETTEDNRVYVTIPFNPENTPH